MWPLAPEKNKMRRNQKGFTIVAALSLAAVLAVGAMFLGQILAYVKSKRMQTQARISSLGYEDSMAVVVANLLRDSVMDRDPDRVDDTPTCDGVDNGVFNERPADRRQIPGTTAELTFDAFVPANVTNGDQTIIVNARVTRPNPGNSERFIDNNATVVFRLEFLNKNSPQDVKTFNPGITCQSFFGLGGTPVPLENRQLKVSYTISWRFRERDINTSGSKLFNLQEIGIN